MATTKQKKGLELTQQEQQACKVYLADGWVPTGRRRVPVRLPLSDGKIVAMGEDAARIDGELKQLRQGKNATSAALQREKKEREGVMHSLSARIIMKKDELGKALDEKALATYTRQQAQVRKDFDVWEEQRKATLQSLKDELDQKEEEHAKLCAAILDGHGEDRVSVVDFTDYKSSTVCSVRIDTGEETGRRALEEHERQIDMWEEISNAESMTDKEYALCTAGRINDAAKSYAERHKMDVMKAKRILVGLINKADDEELPPEAGDEDDDEGGEP